MALAFLGHGGARQQQWRARAQSIRHSRAMGWAKRVYAWVLPLINGVKGWADDRCASMAAALAFYSAFSLAPILVIVIAVAGYFFGAEAVQGRLYQEIAGLVGPDGATAVQAMVASAWRAERGGWTALISVAAVAVGASATFAQLHDALNRIWRVEEPKSSALFSLVRVRLVSFGLVVGIGFLIVVLLVMDAALTFAVERVWGESSSAAQRWMLHLQRGLVLALLTVAFAALLKFLPDTYVRWSNVAVGAIAAALLFSVGKNLFSFYLARAGTANAFGAAGSLAVLLMWLFFSSAVFLLGAQIAAHWTRQRNKGQLPTARSAEEIPVLLR